MAKSGTRNTSADELHLANVFEERAEYLSRADLVEWTELTEVDRQIITKLKGPGAKLLTGPRGSGKSTLLRAAYFQLLDTNAALPVYVNYARSLALEPLFHHNANALQVFRQWILMKIIVGIEESCHDADIAIPDAIKTRISEAKFYIEELGVGHEPPELSMPLSPTALLRMLEILAADLGRRRVVLLLDDAAHAFSHKQQREFFEVFRELRSSRVSAKAAVYPGITSYSPFMHVGHEAELVQAWHRPDSDSFLPTMRAMINRRIPKNLLSRLQGRDELVDYLALASFGLPRGFLVMLSQLLGVEEDNSSTVTRKVADAAVSTHAQSVRDIFQSLSDKMPRYKHFVEAGEDLNRAMVQSLRVYNAKRLETRKAVVIGLGNPLGPELSKVLEMMEYAGLVRSLGTVSFGARGVFHRYELHYALVIQDNALALGKRVAVSSVVRSLKTRDSHALVRTRGTVLLGGDFAERCTLDLAPCQNCGAPRISDEAQFCMKCGRALVEVSLYEELLKAPIERLPLTPKKLAGLAEYTAIRTVGDVLLDDDRQQIRKVPYVGPIWSARIQRYAEEFVSV